MKEQIILLFNQQKTVKEIAEAVGCSTTTVRNYLIKENLYVPNKRGKWNEEKDKELLKLLDEGCSLENIAKKLDVNIRTIQLHKHKLLGEEIIKRASTRNKEDIKLTEEQWEVLYGSLLGDMTIEKPTGKNARPVISHGGEQEAYFDYKCKLFENLIGKINKNERFDKRTNKYYHKYQVKFFTHPIYTKLREELYPNGVKTVSQKWLDKITPKGLAFWFMDDGNNSGVLATNSFSYEECKLIKDWLKDKWNMEVTIEHQKGKSGVQYVIYFTSSAKKILYNLIKPYIIPEMTYKIQGWILKSRELRETPEMDNPEPNLLLEEGAKTIENI